MSTQSNSFYSTSAPPPNPRPALKRPLFRMHYVIDFKSWLMATTAFIPAAYIMHRLAAPRSIIRKIEAENARVSSSLATNP